jgi:hypothetical protein
MFAGVNVFFEGNIKYVNDFDLIYNSGSVNEMVITKIPIVPEIKKDDYIEIDIMNKSTGMKVITEKVFRKNITSG